MICSSSACKSKGLRIGSVPIGCINHLRRFYNGSSYRRQKQIVSEVSEVASKAFAAVVADYQGLSVEQLTTLRVEARKLGVTTRIVRNTLAKRAFQGTQFDILNDNLVGPTILGFSTSEDDMGAAARLFEEFAKLTKHLN